MKLPRALSILTCAASLSLAALTPPVTAGAGNDAVQLSRPPSPNPSRGRIDFTLHVASEEDVDLAVFDLNGRRLATLWSGRLPPGERTFRWDGVDRSGERVRPGLYAVRLRAGRSVSAKLFTMLR